MNRGLQSFNELERPLLTCLGNVLSSACASGPGGGVHRIRVLLPIGSRGSLPFFWFLKQAQHDGRLPAFDLVPRFSVFSIENLSEILQSDQIADPPYREACRFPERDIRRVVYDDIAVGLQGLLDDFNGEPGAGPGLILDFDEVNTLSNLRERAKIYERLRIPEGLDYHVVSVIGTGRANVKKVNEGEFAAVRANWSAGFHYSELVLPSWISWSDDEPFFKQIGIEYPAVAVPGAELVSNLVRKTFVDSAGQRRNGFGLFYHRFFRVFGDELVRDHAPSGYLAFLHVDAATRRQIMSAGNVLLASQRAFDAAVKSCREAGALKRDFRLPELEFDESRCTASDIYSGKPVLSGFSSSLLGQPIRFRDPFMLLDSGSEDKRLQMVRSTYAVGSSLAKSTDSEQ